MIDEWLIWGSNSVSDRQDLSFQTLTLKCGRQRLHRIGKSRLSERRAGCDCEEHGMICRMLVSDWEWAEHVQFCYRCLFLARSFEGSGVCIVPQNLLTSVSPPLFLHLEPEFLDRLQVLGSKQHNLKPPWRTHGWRSMDGTGYP